MSWNFGDNRMFSIKLKAKALIHHDVVTHQEILPNKIILNVVEMQQLPEISKKNSSGKFVV